MPLSLLLVLLSAAAPAPPCIDVPSCVSVAEKTPIEFTRTLRTLVSELPVRVLVDGWSYTHPTPAVNVRVREVLADALVRASDRLESAADAKLLLDFALAHHSALPRGVSTVFIRIAHDPWASLLDGCAGREGLARECAHWAARAGSRAPVVVDSMWSLYLADQLMYSGVESMAASRPLVERFRAHVTELEKQGKPLRSFDARLLWAVPEKWATDMLGRSARHASLDYARPALAALVSEGLHGRLRHRALHQEAVWRAAREPAFEGREDAWRVLGNQRPPWSAAERHALVEFAEESDEARRLLADALVSFAHLDQRAQRLAATEMLGRSLWSGWEAAEREPRSTCWLTEPLREWVDAFDATEETASSTLYSAARWASVHWGLDLVGAARRAAGFSPREGSGRFRCGTGRAQAVRTEAADREAFGVPREVPSQADPSPAGLVQPEVIEPSPDARRQAELVALRAELARVLALPPKSMRKMSCASPLTPRDHASLPPRSPSTSPLLELRSFMQDTALPPVVVRDPDGEEVARVVADDYLLDLPVPAPGVASAMGDWWRGAGRYEFAVDGVGPTRDASMFDLTGEEALVRVNVQPFGRPARMKTYRTGRPEVRVAVTASAGRLEVTVTNRTRDALLPEGGSWREALQLDFERQGWAAGVLRFGPQPFEPTLGPGRSHTFVVDLIDPKPPSARWRLSLRYEVEGLEGQRFITAPVLFESPPEAEPESK